MGSVPNVLTANIEAVGAVDPTTAGRLILPVNNDHVGYRKKDGAVTYRVHRTTLVLSLTEAQMWAAVPRSRPTSILVFGVGVGELVDLCRIRWPDVPVVAWDRDPWLMRLLLGRRDYTEDLQTGRLKICLGPDLLHELEADHTVVPHPLLVTVYHRAKAWLTGPREGPTALLCTGGLFVDDLADALEARGYRIWAVDASRIAAEEFAYVARRSGACLVAAINLINGLPEACAQLGLPLMVWEIDPSIEPPPAPTAPVHTTAVFTWREAHVAPYTDAGFGHVSYLPLAAPPRRQPVALTDAQREDLGAPVCFVGNSLMSEVSRFTRSVVGDLARWLKQQGRPGREAGALFKAILTQQRQDLDRWLIPDLISTHCPGLPDFVRSEGLVYDPTLLIGEIVAAERRLNAVACLAPLGVQVWGDKGWRALTAHGVRYRGTAGHRDALNRIYSAARIHVDIGRLYQPDIVTMRVFDVLACGGFLLAEHTEALTELLRPGVEVETWSSLDELADKARYYLDHPDQAAAIAARGRARVQAAHLIAYRVDLMLRTMASSGAIAPPPVGLSDAPPPATPSPAP